MTQTQIIETTFPLGRVVATSALIHALEESGRTEMALTFLLARHATGDWGNLCDEDKATNAAALKNESRILSKYELGEIEIYIITEWDRSVTTIMRVEDY